MAKFHRVGKILRKKDKSGSYIQLGDVNNRKSPYRVKLKVEDANGNEIVVCENPFIMIQDPRDNPNLSDENKAKIPEFILADLTFVEQDDK
jgi:hypothetical protein